MAASAASSRRQPTAKAAAAGRQAAVAAARSRRHRTTPLNIRAAEVTSAALLRVRRELTCATKARKRAAQ